MNVVGIIAEFNPFHSGHAYLIQRAKELTASDFAVIVMNGDFVQRGEPAVFHKYERTGTALEGGADMILELPVRFGVSSAGDFALGGIMALSSLGFVTHLAFGSEHGEIKPFLDASAILQEESEEFRSILSQSLRKGLSYPAARACALTATADISQSLLEQPNNILGLEYCLAIRKLSSPLIPVTIPRKGMGYHERSLTSRASEDEYPSATALRQQICHDGVPHLTLDDFSDVIGYSLLESGDLTIYKDISPDLADRIRRCLPDYHTARGLAEQCRTRAFTSGRIRRALLQCMLHIKSTEPAMPYLRLLGLQTGASFLLPQAAGSCHILSRLATDTDKLDSASLSLFRQDLFASDLYRQIWCRRYSTHLPNEYQRSPVIRDTRTN